MLKFVKCFHHDLFGSSFGFFFVDIARQIMRCSILGESAACNLTEWDGRLFFYVGMSAYELLVFKCFFLVQSNFDPLVSISQYR